MRGPQGEEGFYQRAAGHSVHAFNYGEPVIAVFIHVIIPAEQQQQPYNTLTLMRRRIADKEP